MQLPQSEICNKANYLVIQKVSKSYSYYITFEFICKKYRKTYGTPCRNPILFFLCCCRCVQKFKLFEFLSPDIFLEKKWASWNVGLDNFLNYGNLDTAKRESPILMFIGGNKHPPLMILPINLLTNFNVSNIFWGVVYFHPIFKIDSRVKLYHHVYSSLSNKSLKYTIGNNRNNTPTPIRFPGFKITVLETTL